MQLCIPVEEALCVICTNTSTATSTGSIIELIDLWYRRFDDLICGGGRVITTKWYPTLNVLHSTSDYLDHSKEGAFYPQRRNEGNILIIIELPSLG